jgi:hypothetical protein
LIVGGGADLGEQEYSEDGYAAFDDAEYTDGDNANRVSAAGGKASKEHNQVMGGYKGTLKSMYCSYF